jgi:hypothetical protein
LRLNRDLRKIGYELHILFQNESEVPIAISTLLAGRQMMVASEVNQ